MDQAKKKKLIWLAVIVLVLVGIFLIIWNLLNRGEQPVGPGQDQEPVLEFEVPSAQLQYNSTTAPQVSDTEFAMLSLAKSYAERYGSWSTDNQGHNLEELMPLSTSRMQATLKSFVPDYSVTEFNGLTTKSLSTKILASSKDSGTVLVSTQRIKTKSNLPAEIFYQNIELKLLMPDDEWLVDSVTWK